VGLLSMSSHAAIVVTIKQVGADVVVMGGGTATAPGLVLIQKYSDLEGFLNPLSGGFAMGRPYELDRDSSSLWFGMVGPEFAGPISRTDASIGGGDAFGIVANGSGSRFLVLPIDYTFGDVLESTNTYSDKTLVDLGLTAGTSYVWTWGSGDTADSFTLTIGETTTAPPVPLPAAAWLLLSGLAGLGAVGRRKRLDPA
jgi:hypothetical protein